MSTVWGKQGAGRPVTPPPAEEVVSSSNNKESSGKESGGNSNSGLGVGRVKAVLSGDSFVVWVQRPGQQAPEEVQITLSLLSAPRIARGKDAGTDQPWAWQSRESLRKLLQAKMVQYRIDYTHPTSGRQYAFVKCSDGSNVNLAVAVSGWARVQEPKAGKGPRGPEHVAMLEAAQRAADSGIGLFNVDPEATARSVRSVKEKFDSWALFDDIRERLPVHGVVEGVLDGTTVRVLLVPSFYSVVVRLSGVQSPIWTRGGNEEGRTAQPFAEQAKYLTEFCLLGRDVSVEVGGVNKDETFYGTVLFGGKNVAEELLKNGLARFVQWSSPESDRAKLQQLETGAQQRGVGVHKGADRTIKTKDFQAVVLDVRSGSRLTVEPEGGAAASLDVFFSSVIAPKLNPKTPREDEACGWEAREHLRKMLIGKKVRVAFDYEKAAREDTQAPPRRFYSVYLNGKHVPLIMVEQGLGQVITHRREEARSREYSGLMQAEESAKKAGRGVWQSEAVTKRIVDQSNLRGPQARQYLRFVQAPQGQRMKAVVEFVMNPVRLKLFVPELSAFISFTVAAVRSPWQDDEYGDEACAWARRHYHQRAIEIDVTTVDKGGNFLGDAFLGSSTNIALSLLETGWASVSRGAERHALLVPYQKAESEAQAARLGIWQAYAPPSEQSEENDTSDQKKEHERNGETGKLLVTEVEGAVFFCQRVSAQHQQVLEQLMDDLQSTNASYVPPLQASWKRGQLCCARYGEDGLWYRVRLVEGGADRKFKINYIDFGNSEVRDERDLRVLAPALHALAPQVIQCRLSLLRMPALVQDCGMESIQAFKEFTFGRVLLASVDLVADNVHHVTLGDPSSGININKEMVRLGLATVESPPSRLDMEQALGQLREAQDEAKRARLSLWRYGDILDQEEEEETQVRRGRF